MTHGVPRNCDDAGEESKAWRLLGREAGSSWSGQGGREAQMKRAVLALARVQSPEIHKAARSGN